MPYVVSTVPSLLVENGDVNQYTEFRWTKLHRFCFILIHILEKLAGMIALNAALSLCLHR